MTTRIAPPSKSTEDPLTRRIRETISAQERAWNAHDIDTFLSFYIPDERVTFVGASGVARGFSGLRTRYAKAYPSTEAMGSLSLTIESITPLGEKFGTVIGRYKLAATTGNSSGIFSLVMVEHNGTMKILLDHTTAEP